MKNNNNSFNSSFFKVGCQWDDLTNVILNASSIYSSGYAIDNVKSEGGNPWHSISLGEQWITFQFPSDVSLAGFRTRSPTSWDGSHFNEFSFQYSTDGGSKWTKFYEGNGSNLDCCKWETVIFGTKHIPASNFQLSMKNNHGYKPLNTYFVIAQLELLNCESNN